MSMQPVLKILDLPELESRIEAIKLGTSRFLPEDIAISTVETMRVITELSGPGQLFSGGTTARLM